MPRPNRSTTHQGSTRRLWIGSLVLSLGLLQPIVGLAGPGPFPEKAWADISYTDLDGDGVLNPDDNCVVRWNASQSDGNGDGIGDACQCGDVNGNGLLESTDADVIQGCYVDTPRSLPDAVCRTVSGSCDTDNDQDCDALDAQRVRNVLASNADSTDLYCNERVVTFGVLSDSASDEYDTMMIPALELSLIGMVWVEILAAHGLDFGPFEPDPSRRGEPRNDGYAHNWARYGRSVLGPETSPDWTTFLPLSLVPQLKSIAGVTVADQTDGLCADIASQKVDMVFMFHGHNDVLQHLYDVGLVTPRPGCDAPPCGGELSGPEFVAFREPFLKELTHQLDVLKNCGDDPAADWFPVFVLELARSALTTNRVPVFAPPFTATAFNSPEVVSALDSINARWESEVRTRNMKWIDVDAAMRARWDAPASQCEIELQCNMVVGSVAVPVDSVAKIKDLVWKQDVGSNHGACWARNPDLCAGLAYATTYRNWDGLHPNTIPYGVAAAEIVSRINEETNLDIEPITDREILNLAFPGLGDGQAVASGDDPDLDQVANWGDNCPHASNPDQADADGDGIGDACECGDATGDGVVDTTDARWAQLCSVGRIPCARLCDVTGDGICNTTDVRVIQLYAVGRLTKDQLHCAASP
jgi:hypothetical protein